MRRSRALWPITAMVLAGASGCGDDSVEDDGGSPSGATGGNQTPATIIDIVVDANRDGVVDAADPGDQDIEDQPLSATSGAVFIANLDDDDGNKIRDAEDTAINAGEDIADIAPIVVSAWPEAPDGATGWLYLDELSSQNVRMHKQNADGTWSLVAGVMTDCSAANPDCQFGGATVLTTEELRTGVILGLEGRDFIRSTAQPWQGQVDLSFQILDVDQAPITSEGAPDGWDRAKMFLAPWLLFGNLSPFDRVFSAGWATEFVGPIGNTTAEAGVEYVTYDWGSYNNQWTQDWLQTGWTAMPKEGGVVHGMKIANARPFYNQQNGGFPIDWLTQNYLGVDAGTLAVYNTPNSGGTGDSHGNHDLIPPHEGYPMGRIVVGSNVLPETLEFYNAQKIQGPYLELYSDWLIVAHIDEVFSYVPANTERGWKLLVGSPTLARQMLEDAEAGGAGDVQMFQGKEWDSGPAAISISDVLTDANLMSWSQESQGFIDDMLAVVVAETGLQPDEIIEIPFLFEDFGGRKVAYNPGTANALVMGDYIIHPDPFGPVVNGEDIFKRDLSERLGTPVLGVGSTGQGMSVNFTDDWDWYHVLLGEVHCGTNPDAPAPFDSKTWWENWR